jgi:hypothetical protein
VREGAHRRPERKTTATETLVEEAGLDGEGRKRLRWHSSSTFRRRLPNGGRTRRRLPRPVAHRRQGLLQTRANGRKRRCLGDSWEWGKFNCVIGGGFYRPGGRGQGRPVGGLRRVFWRRARATPGAAALRACWRGLVAAMGYCGSALARPRRSASCREKRDREGGSGRLLPSPPMSHGQGRGRGGWGSTKKTPQAWLQGSSEGEQHSSQ